MAARASTLLADLGLGSGDRVVTQLPNTHEAFALLFASMLEGVVAVPIGPDLPDAEVGEIIADARPRLVLADRDVVSAAGRLGVPVARLRPGGLDALRPAASTATWPLTRPMAYTSGTTGRRKGVHVGVHDEAWGETVTADEHAAFDRRHGTLHLVVSPLYHSGPLRFAAVTALTGGRVAVLPRFDATLLLETLRALRPTSMFCVPTHLRRLLATEGVTHDDLASLTLLAHAGAPCPTELKEGVLDLAPDGAVWEFYGSTEGQFTVCPPDVWTTAPGTVGRARHGRALEVRSEDGPAADVGETGTVWVHAPEHARFAYWNDQERTEQAWDGDAFTVGDLGHLDADGRLYLDGRPGDLVITGGVNVYPAEVERRLLAAPDIAEAAVFGVPDDEWGERLVAAVVARPGAVVDADLLRDALARQLAAAKVPKQIELVAELPRTATGKVRRDALAATLEAGVP